MEEETQKKKGRGFAGMDPERRKELASKGGKRSHELGKAYKFTKEKAREAGRKGGLKKRTREDSTPTPPVSS